MQVWLQKAAFERLLARSGPRKGAEKGGRHRDIGARGLFRPVFSPVPAEKPLASGSGRTSPTPDPLASGFRAAEGRPKPLARGAAGGATRRMGLARPPSPRYRWRPPFFSRPRDLAADRRGLASRSGRDPPFPKPLARRSGRARPPQTRSRGGRRRRGALRGASRGPPHRDIGGSPPFQRPWSVAGGRRGLREAPLTDMPVATPVFRGPRGVAGGRRGFVRSPSPRYRWRPPFSAALVVSPGGGGASRADPGNSTLPEAAREGVGGGAALRGALRGPPHRHAGGVLPL